MYRFKSKLNSNNTKPCLEISKATSKDEGALVELAIFDLKQKKELTRQSLKFEVKLKLVSDLRAVKPTFLENSTAELTCEVNKKPLKLKLNKNPDQPTAVSEFNLNPSIDYQSLKNDKYEIEITKSLDSFKIKIRINNVQPGSDQDSGKYWIEMDDGQLKTNEANLSIKEVDLEFSENIKTSNKNPLEGIENIEIDFKLNKKIPVAQLFDLEIQVIFNKTKTIEKTSYRIEENEFGYKIIMQNPAQLNDSGNYLLRLTKTQEKSPNSLTFEVTASNIFTLELPETLEVYLDEQLKLEVKSSQSLIVYKWIKDGKKVNSPVSNSTRQQLIYSFVVKNAKLSDSGLYEFVCEDQFRPEMKTKTQCMVTVKERTERQIKSLKDLGTVRVKEGETIDLSVKFDKLIDPATVEIYLNDAKLETNDANPYVTTEFTPTTLVFSIKIENAQKPRDEGKYKVKTPNSESDCQVLVEDKPLRFITELENVKIKVFPEHLSIIDKDYSNEARFECELSRSFTDISWMVNNTLVSSESKKYKIESSSDNTKHTLIFNDCCLADSGSSVQIKLNSVDKISMAKLKVSLFVNFHTFF
jgi:hypothetical protein